MSTQEDMKKIAIKLFKHKLIKKLDKISQIINLKDIDLKDIDLKEIKYKKIQKVDK